MGIQQGGSPQEQDNNPTLECLIQQYTEGQPEGHLDLNPAQLEELIKKILERQVVGNRRVLVLFSDIHSCPFCQDSELQSIVEGAAREAAEQEIPLISNIAYLNQGFHTLKVNVTRYKEGSVTPEVIGATPSMQHRLQYQFTSVPTCALFEEQDGQIRVIGFAVQNADSLGYDAQYETDLRNLVGLPTVNLSQ